ncbi:unnamed protein product [Candida verbasci]|uniref:Uncharacterized protein n=1 Tax=Candida verbasci TaxID=1227364 RepID=A0A9W4XAV8_9ASCO|nr:unnamed protein product [Candida verbasci]
MSLTSNRIALSTISNSHLNSSSSSSSSPSGSSSNTNLSINSTPKKRLLASGSTYSIPNNNFKKRRLDFNSKSFSTSTYVKKHSPLRSVSFSDYRTTSSTKNSPKQTQKQLTRTESAEIAANKLRVRLQIAFSNVKSNQQNKTPINPIKAHQTSKLELLIKSSSTALKSPPRSCKGSPNTTITTLNYDLDKISSTNSLPTPPEQPPTHKILTNSININLKGKELFKTNVNLSKVAKSKQSQIKQQKEKKKENKKLQLLEIKKNSSSYVPNVKKLPLVKNEDKKSLKSISNLSIFNPLISNESILPSISKTSPSESYQLPPIDKILRTPIKESERYLGHINKDSNNNNETTASRIQTTVDDTIEDDSTVLQNSTIVENSTIDQNATIIQHDKEDKKDEDDDEEEQEASTIFKKDILTSSPLNNHHNHHGNLYFGTPNSFSIAKSLLQLGGHRM